MLETPTRFDVKSFIKQTAEESGMSSDDAVAFAEKCYDGMPPVWQPFGGAESFDEIDSKRAADQYQGNVNMENYALQSIITNVMQDENLSAGEKSSKIQAAATAFEARINQLDVSKAPPIEGTKQLTGNWLEGLKARLKKKPYQREDPSVTPETDPVVIIAGAKRDVSTGERKTLAKKGEALPDGSFPIANTSDLKNAIQAIGRAKNPSAAKAHIKKMARKLGATDSLPEGWKEADEVVLGEGFKMFVDNNGDLRWLSLSTNAFEDHSKELFSTKAIEDAIEWSEKMDARGPLRVFHVEGADIGTCDFQAMSGRFLVESGTFDNTVLGQKAVQYIEEHPDVEWQVSVGYYYKEDDDLDGTYDWMRIKERSILPAGMADNPYTGFWTHKSGEKAMHSKAKGVLEDLFGPEITAGVIARAEEGTKSLEEAGIRFKMAEDEFGEITDVEEIVPEDGEKAKPEPVLMAHEHGPIRHKHRVVPESEHSHTGLTEGYKAMPAALQAAIDKKKEDAADGGKDDASENADGSKKTGKKEGEDPSGVDLSKLATVLGNLVDRVEALGEVTESVKELKEGVKALQASDEERMGSFLQTRYTLPGGITVRPTDSGGNVIDATKAGVKELVEGAGDQPTNPVAPYIEDLLGHVRIQQG